MLDAVRIGPGEDVTEVTATQIRDLLARLVEAGEWREGDAAVLFVLDAGYDMVRLTLLLHDVPVRCSGRIRADRVMRRPRRRRKGPAKGRQPRHGEVSVSPIRPATRHRVLESVTVHDRFGAVVARCWSRLHPKLDRRGSWAGHEGELPIVEGTSST